MSLAATCRRAASTFTAVYKSSSSKTTVMRLLTTCLPHRYACTSRRMVSQLKAQRCEDLLVLRRVARLEPRDRVQDLPAAVDHEHRPAAALPVVIDYAVRPRRLQPFVARQREGQPAQLPGKVVVRFDGVGAHCDHFRTERLHDLVVF